MNNWKKYAQICYPTVCLPVPGDLTSGLYTLHADKLLYNCFYITLTSVDPADCNISC